MNKGTEVGGKNDLANKRIVQIASISSPGGISTHLVNLLDAIPKFGAKVTLIGLSDKKINRLSCDYIVISNKRNPTGYTHLFNLWLKAPFLKIASTDLICTHRPDDMFPFILFHRKNPKRSDCMCSRTWLRWSTACQKLFLMRILQNMDWINMKHYISVVKSNREKVSLSDEIGVTVTMVRFVENYPESFREIKESPEIQYRFK